MNPGIYQKNTLLTSSLTFFSLFNIIKEPSKRYCTHFLRRDITTNELILKQFHIFSHFVKLHLIIISCTVIQMQAENFNQE